MNPRVQVGLRARSAHDGGVVTVKDESAFRINRAAVNGEVVAFPLSLHVERTGDVTVVAGTAAALHEIGDVLVAGARATLLVFGAGYHAEVTLAERAAELGLDVAVRDVAWSAADPHAPSELAVLRKGDLVPLLGELYPYDVHVADVTAADEGTQDEVVLLATTGCGVPPVLESLPGSTLLYDGHDDCYLYVETRDATLPERLLTRLLALLAGSVLGEGDTTVAEPPPGVARALLAESPRWVAMPEEVTGERVVVGLRPDEWRLGDAVAPHPVRTLVYDVVVGAWDEPG